MLIQRGVNKCDMESDVGYVIAGIKALNIIKFKFTFYLYSSKESG